MKILVAIFSTVYAWNIPEDQVEQLRRDFPDHTFVRADSDAEVLERIVDAEVVYCSWINAEQFAAARRLRWVHSNAAGIGPLLFPAMIASPIPVTNSSGVSSVTIAEHVIAVALALLRELPLAWRRQAEQRWSQHEFDSGARMKTLRGARVLVIGLGSIGRETATLAAAFGAHVVGVRRRGARNAPPSHATEIVGPERLHAELPKADVVVIAAPHTNDTAGLIGERELALIKDDAVLVNISRGTLIDEAALVRTLESGRLRGAALDVFEHEPLAAGSPLWRRGDVIVTPHVSGFHADYWPTARRMFADNLRRFIDGRPLANIVDKQAGY